MIVAKPDDVEIKGELAGAHEQLKAAEVSLRKKLLKPAVSAAYYAIFHAARSVLWSIGRTAKTHQGISRLFHRHYIKSKKVARI